VFVASLPVSISGAEIALGVLLALTVAALATGERRWVRTPLDRALLAFFAVLVTSTVAGGPTADALDAYRDLWVIGTYAVTVVMVDGAAQAARLVRLLVLTAAAVAAYGIVQHFAGIDLYRTLAGREVEIKPSEFDPTRFAVIGFFPSYLTFAHGMMVPLGFAVAAAIGPAPGLLRRWQAAASALLMGVAVILSTARGAWLGAGAMVAGAAWLARGQARAAVLAAASAVAAALFLAVPGLYIEGRSITADGANEGRLAIYAANLELIGDHPLLGVGFGNYRRDARRYYEKHPGADRRSHAHNTFLQVAAEAGAAGLVAFCYVFGKILVGGWRFVTRVGADGPQKLWALGAGAWLGVVAFLVGGLTQHTFGDSECVLPLWFAAAILTVLQREVAPGARVAQPAR
jgi:O-antigen ligase